MSLAIARLGLRWAASLLLLCALSACSSLQAPQTQSLRAQTPAGLPARTELEAVPFFPQTVDQCGPAALATALGAVGLDVTPHSLGSEVFVPQRGGSLQIEMLAASRRHGAVSTLLQPDLAKLLQEVAAGHAPVVLLNLSLPIYPLWHYAVVVGYDLPRDEVLMRSGTTQRLAMPLATFEHTWARSGQWAFVALPAGTLPATATEAALTQASVDFERLAPPAQAEKAYRAALTLWPDNALLGLGLGNVLFASSQWAASAQALAHVARTHDSAAAWNNLAMAHLAAGSRADALLAAEQAVRRARTAEPAWLDAAQATLAEVKAAPVLPATPR